ncbi:unnamed protein product [Staurois parvus]|uniref:Uncharacterized protein n=1 Tax=Staurois parvus TaxID=386267 RepID=A0ABN9C4C0_9NEOB|nr:unnamed protein product [Staurois parvus]
MDLTCEEGQSQESCCSHAQSWITMRLGHRRFFYLSAYNVARGGLTIWKLGHCLRARVSRGSHKMPLVPFS